MQIGMENQNLKRFLNYKVIEGSENKKFSHCM